MFSFGRKFRGNLGRRWMAFQNQGTSLLGIYKGHTSQEILQNLLKPIIEVKDINRFLRVAFLY